MKSKDLPSPLHGGEGWGEGKRSEAKMNISRFASAAIFTAFLSASASAHEPDRFPMPSIESLFSGLIQEQDVALAFGYLRESLDSAVQGREPSPPPEALVRRGEAIAEEAKQRGAATARTVLDAIEAMLREKVREPSVREPAYLPPAGPGRRI